MFMVTRIEKMFIDEFSETINNIKRASEISNINVKIKVMKSDNNYTEVKNESNNK